MPDIEDETMAEETAVRPEKTGAKAKAAKGPAKASPGDASPANGQAAEAGEVVVDGEPAALAAEGAAATDAKPGADQGETSEDGAKVESAIADPPAAEIATSPEASGAPARGSATSDSDREEVIDLSSDEEIGQAAGSMPRVWQQLIAAEARVAALTTESADLKDRLWRAAAEMENLRRRTEREVADGRQYAVTSFAREIVQVGDNLRRAIETVLAEQGERSPSLSSLLEGIEATERLFYHVLSKHGVRRLEPKGEKFDANFHQAMYETEDPGDQPGTVTSVLQPGYAIGERVLRPALVSVAKSAKNKAPSSG